MDSKHEGGLAWRAQICVDSPSTLVLRLSCSIMYICVGALAVVIFIGVRIMASFGVSDRAIMLLGLISEVIG